MYNRGGPSGSEVNGGFACVEFRERSYEVILGWMRVGSRSGAFSGGFWVWWKGRHVLSVMSRTTSSHTLQTKKYLAIHHLHILGSLSDLHVEAELSVLPAHSETQSMLVRQAGKVNRHGS